MWYPLRETPPLRHGLFRVVDARSSLVYCSVKYIFSFPTEVAYDYAAEVNCFAAGQFPRAPAAFCAFAEPRSHYLGPSRTNRRRASFGRHHALFWRPACHRSGGLVARQRREFSTATAGRHACCVHRICRKHEFEYRISFWFDRCITLKRGGPSRPFPRCRLQVCRRSADGGADRGPGSSRSARFRAAGGTATHLPLR